MILVPNESGNKTFVIPAQNLGEALRGAAVSLRTQHHEVWTCEINRKHTPVQRSRHLQHV